MEFRLLLAMLSWFLVGWQQLDGCLDEERMALFHIKLSFDVPGYASPLASWARDGSDCCSWDRVSCGSMAGRVQSLRLYSARPWSDFYTFNATLFLPFQELRRLDLTNNHINDCVPNGGFDRLSNLSKLEFLDLSWNTLNDSILPSLAALTSLKALYLHEYGGGSDLHVHGLVAWSKLSKLEYLDLSSNALNETLIPSLVGISSLKTLLLSGNGMSGRLPIRELCKLSKLEYLDLAHNMFDETVIPSLVGISSLKTLLLSYNNMSGRLPIRELCKLSRLEVLDLSENGFLGMFQTLPEEWTSLKALSLSSNKLNGTLPVQGLCKIKNLHELDLSNNQLIGVLPSCLGNLTSLRFFDVSDNHLQVRFPSQLISNLTSLEYLSLSNNQFEGILFFNALYNHSNLKMLILVDENNKLEVETESLVVAPSFQLEGLILSNCSLNKDSGAIPSFLSTQYALQWIDLSLDNLKGHIPNWFLENKTNLRDLNLKSNSLSGPLILPSQQNNNASRLDLSENEFSGEVPTNMGIIFPNLIYLNLSRNFFQGSIPSSFGYMTRMQFLDLSDNSLSGKITETNFTYWSSLIALHLSNNKFYGRMPTYSIQNSLSYMFLDGNRFIGEIPSSICGMNSLENLDISGNQLSGRLPNCMGSLGSLSSLNAEGNHLEGHIPNGFCNLGILNLDLSSNHLSGSIPRCFNLSSLQYLHLQDNGLTGPFPIALSSSPEIITIDLRNNHLSGNLPSWTGGSLENLRVLLLGGNHLEGSIPNQMCRLKHVRILDLSHNNISGRIPLCFKNMGFQDGDFAPFEYSESVGGNSQDFFPDYKGLISKGQEYYGWDDTHGVDEEVFLTKSRSYSYKGEMLNYMSGIDLSCNQLAGEIPMEIGSMSWLRALNLSNNQLTGPIPHSLSNLKELESLDLSHNMLTGPLPRELTEMHFLAIFSVAYNNLSGPTLGRDGQFITFDESSYEGNPDLCGPPLEKNCTSSPAALPSPLPDEDDDGDHGDDAIDRLIFFGSFALAFVMGFWGYMAVLYFKDEWRYTLFRAADRYSEAGFTKICGLLARIKAFW